MNHLRIWEQQQKHRAVCPEPGQLDRFLVVLVNGRRVGIFGVDQHSHLRMVCVQHAMQHQCQIKVLPVTGEELLNLFGFEPAEPQPMDPAFRQHAIKACSDVLRDSQNADERAEAMAFLHQLGAVQ